MVQLTVLRGTACLFCASFLTVRAELAQGFEQMAFVLGERRQVHAPPYHAAKGTVFRRAIWILLYKVGRKGRCGLTACWL